MDLFYYDDILRSFENKLNFISAIQYLENMFIQKREDKTLISLIAYSWYYFIEGQFMKKDISDDELDFLFNSWKKYYNLGCKYYSESPEFCLIAGYIIQLHGFYLEISNHEKQGIKLMKECLKLNKNPISILAQYFISGKKSNNFNELCQTLFSSNSILDEYFKDLLMIKTQS